MEIEGYYNILYHSVRIRIIEIIMNEIYFSSQKRHRNLSICVKIREHLGPKETIYDARIRNEAKSIYASLAFLLSRYIFYIT